MDSVEEAVDADMTRNPMVGVSQASYDYVQPMWDSIGSMVIGRRLFDLTNGWEVSRLRRACGRGVPPR